jgi:hypothetical protein
MLIDLYHKYKAKGFEIFGISVDDKRNNWINALLKDRLTWINTADLVPLNKNKATITLIADGLLLHTCFFIITCSKYHYNTG